MPTAESITSSLRAVDIQPIPEYREIESFVQASPWAKEIHSLKGYAFSQVGGVQPLWGDRAALWYAPNGKLVSIKNDDVWLLWDVLKKPRNSSALAGVFGDDIVCDVMPVFEQVGLVTSDGKHKDTRISDTATEAEVYLQATEMCDFACSGCAAKSDILPLVNNAQTLPPDLTIEYLDAAVRASAEKGYKTLTVKWAGGEPTLGRPFKLIQQSQDQIRQLQNQYPGVNIKQTILSNGSGQLNPEKIAWMRDHDIHLAISIWGVGEMNDRMRPTWSGKSTWDAVKRNILTSVDMGLNFNLLTVVGAQNAHDFPRLIRFLWDRQNEEYLFAGRTQPEEPVKLAVNFFRPQTREQEEQANGQREQFMNGLRVGFGEILRLINEGQEVSIPDRWDYLALLRTQTRTCGSGDHYILMGPKGIGSCHEESGTDHLDTVERMRRGENVFDIAAGEYDDPLLLRADRMKYPDKESAMLMTHGGAACPRSRKSENNDFTVLPAMAGVYRDITDELLALYVAQRSTSSVDKRSESYLQCSFTPCANCSGGEACELYDRREAARSYLRSTKNGNMAEIAADMKEIDPNVETLSGRVTGLIDEPVSQVIFNCPTTDRNRIIDPKTGEEDLGHVSVGKVIPPQMHTTVRILN